MTAATERRFSALIVEDNEDFRDSLARLVEREGFAASQAADLEDARAALAREAFDVVLVDLSLPDGDGLGLLAEERAAPCEFIVITGNASLDSVGSGDFDVHDVRGNLTVRRVGSGSVDHSGVAGTVSIPKER